MLRNVWILNSQQLANLTEEIFLRRKINTTSSVVIDIAKDIMKGMDDLRLRSYVMFASFTSMFRKELQHRVRLLTLRLLTLRKWDTYCSSSIKDKHQDIQKVLGLPCQIHLQNLKKDGRLATTCLKVYLNT